MRIVQLAIKYVWPKGEVKNAKKTVKIEADTLLTFPTKAVIDSENVLMVELSYGLWLRIVPSEWATVDVVDFPPENYSKEL